MLAPLALFAGVLLVDEHAAHADVAETEQHMRLGRRAVAARRARSPGNRLPGCPAGRCGRRSATSGLSMPMPKAMVATITTPGSVMKRVLVGLARVLVHAGVIGAARRRRSRCRNAAVSSVFLRDRQ